MRAAGRRRFSRALAATLATLSLVGVAAVASVDGMPGGVERAPSGRLSTRLEPGSVLEPSGRRPLRLSETGLYGPDGSIDPRNRPFAPQYPLWTDGAAKSRWIRLPDGATIDVSDMDAWRFPVGTTFWKEFAWAGLKVETRMIQRGADVWRFATYVWTQDQTDALLAPEEGVRAAFEIVPGRWHSVPGVADCHACHDSSPSVVLGFGALQISDDRDPLAPHAEPLPPGALTLRFLVEENRLDPPRPDLASQTAPHPRR